ncbi:MAG: ATP-binding cassette domain-containing protein [Verrucomicrobiota bacterium]
MSLQNSELVIGRKNADFVVANAFVSSRHARVYQDARGQFFIEDLGSANGTFVNDPSRRIAGSVPLQENDLVYFSRSYRVPAQTLIRRLESIDSPAAQTGGESSWSVSRTFTHGIISIGSDQKCDVCLPFLSVRDQHAEIRQSKTGERYLCGNEATFYVNGESYRTENVAVLPADEIEVGGVRLSLNFDPSDVRTLQVGVEREGIYLETDDLRFIVKHRETGEMIEILKGIDLAVFPGEMVGLMGPSGCGKTTLLNLLSGTTVTNAGKVRLNGVPLEPGGGRFANQIGYVPQDDIMHTELTVKEVLYYSAKLRLPSSTTDEAIYAKIDELCLELGLYKPDPNLQYEIDLRNTLVGSPQKKTLSGGQKKRVNLAIELLTDPRILFLDEPTSGLSSEDTRGVMNALRKLANEKGIAIIITIHQPAPKIYGLFDKVILLKAGQLCFFGRPFPESTDYFSWFSSNYLTEKEVERPGEVDGPDDIMECLDRGPSDRFEKLFRGSEHFQQYVVQRKERLFSDQGSLPPATNQERPSILSQFRTLLVRAARCKYRDRTASLILLIQAPFVAGLLILAFYENSLTAPLFLIVFVAIWLGTNNSARELVGEIDVYRRERRSGLLPGPYLASKIVLQGLIVAVQCGLLIIITIFALDFDISWFWAVFIGTLCGLIGVSIGLLISVFSKSEVTAIVTVPLVLIPFILFSGFVSLYDDAGGLAKATFNVMPTRWGFEAMLHAENYVHEEKEWESERNGRYQLREFSRESMEDLIDSTKEKKWVVDARRDPEKLPVPPVAEVAEDVEDLELYRRRRIALCLIILFPYLTVASGLTWYWLQSRR